MLSIGSMLESMIEEAGYGVIVTDYTKTSDYQLFGIIVMTNDNTRYFTLGGNTRYFTLGGGTFHCAQGDVHINDPGFAAKMVEMIRETFDAWRSPDIIGH